jgi:hypothetical protein
VKDWNNGTPVNVVDVLVKSVEPVNPLVVKLVALVAL